PSGPGSPLGCVEEVPAGCSGPSGTQVLRSTRCSCQGTRGPPTPPLSTGTFVRRVVRTVHPHGSDELGGAAGPTPPESGRAPVGSVRRNVGELSEHEEEYGVTERLRLMAVHAHPDDESSKGAATMARYVDEGAD